jgi:hypothetical protein
VFITGEISNPGPYARRGFLACGHHATERWRAVANTWHTLGRHTFSIDNPA